MNIKISTLLTSAVALMIAFSSCNKIKEATQRDISISPAGVTFTVPIITSLDAGTTIGTVPVTIDLDALIKAQASKFGISNVRNVRITGVKIKLNDSDDTNNFANLENLTAKIKASGQSDVTVASVPSNPDTKSSELTIPITGGNAELKSFVTASSFSYVLTGKARRVTTKPLSATATFTYTLTVGL
ncbi:hypothetical protein [Pedobacter frigoris]|uniref:hypothetical protein n=1 Tax=Pedobacter frigoris TaxID=2571272 RepID=UPI00292DEB77|nr:hypothetical protein [Pedobacter frigoris]